MDSVTVRPATTCDAEAIAGIYNHYIATSTATFDTVAKSVEDRVEWIAVRGSAHPVIVAEKDGRVVAWGALTAWASRPAYSRTVEVAVYVEADQRGSGLGPRILERLVVLGREAGHHSLVAQIVSDNRASIEMMRRAGFEQAGVLHEVGRKFDRWLDVVLMERVV